MVTEDMGQTFGKIQYTATPSGRKKLRGIGEALEFQGVATGVVKKESGLFTNFAFEPNLRRNQKLAISLLEALSQRAPIVHIHDDTEVARGHSVAVH